MNLETLLTREQKESILLARVADLRPGLEREVCTVRYDRRFAFDFEVVRGPAGKARVTFSTAIGAEKFGLVIERLAQAIFDIRYTSTPATSIRGRVEG